MLYITYFENNVFKKAIVDSIRYNALISNPNITELVIHPNEQQMNESGSRNKSNSHKQLLHS